VKKRIWDVLADGMIAMWREDNRGAGNVCRLAGGGGAAGGRRYAT
jgi:hypothetical protein